MHQSISVVEIWAGYGYVGARPARRAQEPEAYVKSTGMIADDKCKLGKKMPTFDSYKSSARRTNFETTLQRFQRAVYAKGNAEGQLWYLSTSPYRPGPA